jgi:hypothetical protein
MRRLESDYPVRPACLLALLLIADAAVAGDVEMTVSLDPAEQSGVANATVRIHARREIVWSLITSCPESLALVPGLEACDVLETSPDGSWQKIRHVMSYSWFAPKVSYEIRATYDPPSRVAIERISGDLRTLRGSWVLNSEGDFTAAHYMVDLAPGFWVPHWLVTSALRHDLPKMLRALRSRAEYLQSHTP